MFWSVMQAGAVVRMALMVSMGGSHISENGLKRIWSLRNIVEALQMLLNLWFNQNKAELQGLLVMAFLVLVGN